MDKSYIKNEPSKYKRPKKQSKSSDDPFSEKRKYKEITAENVFDDSENDEFVDNNAENDIDQKDEIKEPSLQIKTKEDLTPNHENEENVENVLFLPYSKNDKKSSISVNKPVDKKKNDNLFFQDYNSEQESSEGSTYRKQSNAASNRKRDKSPAFLKFNEGNSYVPHYGEGIADDDSYIGTASHSKKMKFTDPIDDSSKPSMSSDKDFSSKHIKKNDSSESSENEYQKPGLIEYKPKDSWNHKLKQEASKDYQMPNLNNMMKNYSSKP
jgi:hypothetical protein